MSHLRELREERGLLIKQVSGELTEICKSSPEKYGIKKVSAALYGYWERGDRKPSSNQLCLLADYYQVSTDFLLERTDIRPERKSVLKELGLEQDEWWEIRHEATPDERACAKIFAWTVSGKSIEEILKMDDDEDWKKSKWQEPDKKPDKSIVQAMLMRALDDGVVNITAEKIPQNEKLAKDLKESFPFLREREVIVIRGFGNELLTKILVGEAAALFFNANVRPGYKVGMSGGSTLARMVSALKKYPCTGIRLYAFDGGLMPESVENCANTLIGRIKYSHPASNIDAYALQTFGFDDSPRAYSFPPNRRSVLDVIFGAENADVGFLGFGAVTVESLHEDPVLSPALRIVKMTPEELVDRDKAIGNILFQYIKNDGTYIPNKLNKRIAAMNPSKLHKLAEAGRPIVGVASGDTKGKAGLAVLNGGYINNLIVDNDLAEKILEAKKDYDKK